MNPIRWAFVALAVLVLVAAPLVARGCHDAAPPSVSADTSPTVGAASGPTEALATTRATSAETDSRALLDQADADAETIARLEAGIDAARGAERIARADLAAARARTNILITAPVRTIRDTVLVWAGTGPEAPPSDLPDLLAERIVVERAASDRALAACDVRADTAEALVAVQTSRATWAYAAADSALAALSYTRLAYAEADRRASSASRLATRRGRLLTVAGGLLVGACAVAILR